MQTAQRQESKGRKATACAECYGVSAHRHDCNGAHELRSVSTEQVPYVERDWSVEAGHGVSYGKVTIDVSADAVEAYGLACSRASATLRTVKPIKPWLIRKVRKLAWKVIRVTA